MYGISRVKKCPLIFLYRVGCLIGFSIHVSAFLRAYLKYPIKTQTSSVIRTDFIVPAMSMTTSYWSRNIKSLEEWQPPDVYQPSCTICDHRDHMPYGFLCYLCGAAGKDVWIHSLPIQDFVKLCNTSRGHTSCVSPENLYPVTRFLSTPYFVAYTINSEVEGKNPKYLKTSSRDIITFQTTETTVNRSQPNFLFSVHDNIMVLSTEPDITNQMQSYLYLDFGKSYTIFLKRTKWLFLPPPFEPGCLNYRKESLRRGSERVLSKQMCIEKCYKDVSIRKIKCVDLESLRGRYSVLKRSVDLKCTNQRRLDPYESETIMYECKKQCLRNCRKENPTTRTTKWDKLKSSTPHLKSGLLKTYQDIRRQKCSELWAV